MSPIKNVRWHQKQHSVVGLGGSELSWLRRDPAAWGHSLSGRVAHSPMDRPKALQCPSDIHLINSESSEDIEIKSEFCYTLCREFYTHSH